ncbi:transposase [Microaceticoccus formicicus]|uniref:transposase n=1 Tax=Microaceticoccus formicicus TaxID=3118105 RepID=UPI003CD03664|nr:transposase [Peptoniphilaceae bacterium AMB_02]
MAYEKDSKQLSFYDGPSQFEGVDLDPENRWVKLADIIPWDLVEDVYAQNFPSNMGRKAYSSKIAFGAILVKDILKVTDQELVYLITENPYLQYFFGEMSFSNQPIFSTSSMTRFKRRFKEEDIIYLYDQTNLLLENEDIEIKAILR